MKYSLIFSSFLLTWLMATAALALGPKTAIYLSVFKKNENTFWAKDTCKKIYNDLQNSDYAGTEVHCDWNQDENFLSEKNKLVRQSHYFQYMLELKETSSEYHLRWINWNRIDDLDFLQAGWTIKKQPNTDLYLKKLLTNLLDLQNYRVGLRRHLITQAMQQSQKTALDHALSEGEMAAWIKSDPKNKAYLKNALDALVILGLGPGDEVKNKEAAKDLDDADALATLLGEPSKLKNPINWKRLNSADDSLMKCRSNTLKDLDLLLCSKVASMGWEMILEYRQSLNLKKELLLNSAIGPLLTGSFFEFEKIMESSKNSVAQKNLKEIFSSAQDIENLVPPQNFSLLKKFQIDSQATEENRIPDKTFLETPQGPKKLITSLNFSRRFSEKMLMEPYKDFTQTAQMAMATYYQKNKGYELSTPIQGYNLFIGSRKAIDNRTQFKFGSDPRVSDFISSVHVLGSTLKLVTYSHGWRISAILDIYADFASVRNYSIVQFPINDIAVELGQRKNPDYYYAIGTTNLAQIIFEYGNFGFDISGQHQNLSNLNGVAANPLLPQTLTSERRSDQFVGLEAGAQYRLSTQLSIRFAVNETQRTGHLEDTANRSAVNQTAGVQLIYKF